MTTSMLGAEQVMIENWIQETLESFTDFNTLFAGLTSRIFEGVAPRGTVYPFITYQCQSPPMDVKGVGTARFMVDSVYQVRVTSQSNDSNTIVPVARAIDQAMTCGQGVTLDAGFINTSYRIQQIYLTTIEDSVKFRHLGGYYRIQATAN